jgi:glycerophosphoryl diester phosphodiesterase
VFKIAKPLKLSLQLAVLFLIMLFFAGCAEYSRRNSRLYANSGQSGADALHQRDQNIKWYTAHRGDRQKGVDNSISSIEAAAKLGAPLIEIDIRRSLDNELFLFHDKHFKQGNYYGAAKFEGTAIEEYGSADLRNIHIDSKNTELATFSAALESVLPERSILELDLKGESNALVDIIVSIAKRYGAEKRIMIQCQKLETLTYIRKQYPNIMVLARLHAPGQLSLAAPYRPEIVQIDREWLSEKLVAAIHAVGSRVLVKAVDDPIDDESGWQELFQKGADIILTDKPENFERFLETAR